VWGTSALLWLTSRGDKGTWIRREFTIGAYVRTSGRNSTENSTKFHNQRAILLWCPKIRKCPIGLPNDQKGLIVAKSHLGGKSGRVIMTQKYMLQKICLVLDDWKVTISVREAKGYPMPSFLSLDESLAFGEFPRHKYTGITCLESVFKCTVHCYSVFME